MRRPGRERLAGAALAAAVFGGVVVFPAELAVSPPPPRAGLAVPGDAPEALERVDARLALRLPRLADPDRRLLAHTIAREAESARIDPLLVLAVIEVESAWRPEARSGRGARGLMQLREPTMRRELERSGLVFEDAHDPVANVQAGVRYLRRLLDAFGRVELALMAYNAGPNRILGYLREGEIPPRFHVYPRRVKTELRRLRRGLAGSGPQLAAAAAAPGPQ